MSQKKQNLLQVLTNNPILQVRLHNLLTLNKHLSVNYCQQSE